MGRINISQMVRFCSAVISYYYYLFLTKKKVHNNYKLHIVACRLWVCTRFLYYVKYLYTLFVLWMYLKYLHYERLVDSQHTHKWFPNFSLLPLPRKQHREDTWQVSQNLFFNHSIRSILLYFNALCNHNYFKVG